VNPTYHFENQVALVTGAASGMGLATARAFAEAGAAVVLADVDKHAVATATEELTSAGRQAIGVTCDVTDEHQAAEMVQRAVTTFGRLDMAFNNAGVQVPPSDAADETAEDFDRVNAVNLRGVWASMKHELREMRRRGSGAIVNCSSLGGLVGLPQRAAYHASKHGVIGLTRSVAVEYAPKGIRVNAVCPGVIDTPMVADMLTSQADAMTEIIKEQPIGRLGHSDEIAAACCATLKITTGAAFTMPTTIPANRTARSVKCRPSSARRRERPVVLHSTTGLARSAWGFVRPAPLAAYQFHVPTSAMYRVTLRRCRSQSPRCASARTCR
jgi:NAD(P)-dependent dehydrogenase (short-subunit alcohol dehydrogenase family)